MCALLLPTLPPAISWTTTYSFTTISASSILLPYPRCRLCPPQPGLLAPIAPTGNAAAPPAPRSRSPRRAAQPPASSLITTTSAASELIVVALPRSGGVNGKKVLAKIATELDKYFLKLICGEQCDCDDAGAE